MHHHDSSAAAQPLPRRRLEAATSRLRRAAPSPRRRRARWDGTCAGALGGTDGDAPFGASRAHREPEPQPSTAAPRTAKKLVSLHVPKAGTSFGTSEAAPAGAAADDGAPIVSLTERYPRGKRRWCDRNAFAGNLNGHERRASPAAATPSLQPLRGRGGRVPPRFWRRGRSCGGGARRRRASAARGGCGSAAASTASPSCANSSSRTATDAAIATLTNAWNAGRSIPLATCDAGAHGCQTKMVLGVPCAATRRSRPRCWRRRCAVVRRVLRFVGLTERFDASVCLFHAQLGGAPVAAQFENARPAVARAVASPPRGAHERHVGRRARCARERLERELRAVANHTRRLA